MSTNVVVGMAAEDNAGGIGLETPKEYLWLRIVFIYFLWNDIQIVKFGSIFRI